ncbi:MAG: NAD(P)H-hydrate dehydratase [Promethearchaeota archaeon]
MRSKSIKWSVKGDDIGRFDDNAEDLGIPKRLLMECAGLQATEHLLKQYPLPESSKIAIFCGTGNNGGDGFVIARHLATRGFHIQVFICGNPAKIRTPEARQNWELLARLPLNIQLKVLSDSSLFPPPLANVLNESTALAIDALLGTGISGTIREPIKSAINLINSLKIPKISVDIPSGMDPDTGSIPDLAVQCDFRITFHREKIGLSGTPQTIITPIGIPLEAEWFVGKGDLRRGLKQRNPEDHKGQYGKLLIIGGSETYSGAPSLAAMAAVEFGIDLVSLLAPTSVASTIRSYSPNLIVREGQSEILTEEDLPLAKELCSRADAVVIGPGIGNTNATAEFCKNLLMWINAKSIPCVIDADALKFLSDLIHLEQFSFKNPNIVLTPHAGELKQLLQISNLPPNGEYWEMASFLVEKFQEIKGICVLKGKNDYIVDNYATQPENREHNGNKGKDLQPHHLRINRTGCPEMTVGGTGDILAGLTGAFLAIGVSPFNAATCATYLNGRLGEEAKEKFGRRIQATDMIHALRPYLRTKNFFKSKNQ